MKTAICFLLAGVFAVAADTNKISEVTKTNRVPVVAGKKVVTKQTVLDGLTVISNRLVQCTNRLAAATVEMSKASEKLNLKYKAHLINSQNEKSERAFLEKYDAAHAAFVRENAALQLQTLEIRERYKNLLKD